MGIRRIIEIADGNFMVHMASFFPASRAATLGFVDRVVACLPPAGSVDASGDRATTPTRMALAFDVVGLPISHANCGAEHQLGVKVTGSAGKAAPAPLALLSYLILSWVGRSRFGDCIALMRAIFSAAVALSARLATDSAGSLCRLAAPSVSEIALVGTMCCWLRPIVRMEVTTASLALLRNLQISCHGIIIPGNCEYVMPSIELNAEYVKLAKRRNQQRSLLA